MGSNQGQGQGPERIPANTAGAFKLELAHDWARGGKPREQETIYKRRSQHAILDIPVLKIQDPALRPIFHVTPMEKTPFVAAVVM